jgi:hypothetical protein
MTTLDVTMNSLSVMIIMLVLPIRAALNLVANTLKLTVMTIMLAPETLVSLPVVVLMKISVLNVKQMTNVISITVIPA